MRYFEYYYEIKRCKSIWQGHLCGLINNHNGPHATKSQLYKPIEHPLHVWNDKGQEMCPYCYNATLKRCIEDGGTYGEPCGRF